MPARQSPGKILQACDFEGGVLGCYRQDRDSWPAPRDSPAGGPVTQAHTLGWLVNSEVTVAKKKELRLEGRSSGFP